MRWSCPWVLTDEHFLGRMLMEADQIQQTHSASRVTLKAVSLGELSAEQLVLLKSTGYTLEAQIHVNDSRQKIINYLGKNLSERSSNKEDHRKEQVLLDKIRAHPLGDPKAVFDSFSTKGDLAIEMLNAKNMSTNHIDHLIDMHRMAFPTFPYNFAQKLELMLSQSDQYLMACIRAKHSLDILSFCNVELAQWELSNGDTLTMAEFDNTMKLSGKNGTKVDLLGSLPRLKLELARSAALRGANICHIECRAGLGSIHISAQRCGMAYGGKLEKHLLISGENSIEYQQPLPYESMQLWYLDEPAMASFRH